MYNFEHHDKSVFQVINVLILNKVVVLIKPNPDINHVIIPVIHQ